MNILYSTHRLLLQKLIEKEVDFILVGGYAVNYHGYNRVTGDMDIWLRPDNDNKAILISALQDLDYDYEGLAVIDGWDFTRPQLFSIGRKPDLTDFMTFISGVKFNDVRSSALKAEIDGLQLLIIQVSHLLQNKKASGRLKDLADVEYLEKILNLKKK